MRTVHVRIGHDDDPAVPQFFEVEGSFAVAVSDSGADGGDHRLNFQILQHLVQTGLLDVYQFSANWKNRLKSSVTTLFGGATGGIAFHDVELGQVGIAF